MELKPCPMCGSAVKIDATGTTECYGWAWQTLYIECQDEKKQNCGMELSLDMDFGFSETAHTALEEAWNRIAGSQSDGKGEQ